MRKGSVLSLMFAAGANLLTAVPAFADTTPEEAVTAYIEGVADRDLDAVIAATTADDKSTHFDFVAYVDRIMSLSPWRTPLPTTDPLFVKINKQGFSAQVASQVQILAYGLMTTNDLGKSQKMDAAEATALASILRADRLSSLKLVKVAIPRPDLLNKENYQLNAIRMAKVNGADTATERLVLLSFEDLTFVVGFTLLKYGDDWKVESASSPIAGIGLAETRRVTPEEFEKMLK